MEHFFLNVLGNKMNLGSMCMKHSCTLPLSHILGPEFNLFKDRQRNVFLLL